MKRRLYYLCLLLGLLSLASCRKSKPIFTVFTDFDHLAGWVNPLPTFLTTEQAYSGKYSYRMSPGAEYGPGYSTTLAALASSMPHELYLRAWVYLPSGRIRATMLVVVVNCHGRRPDVWNAINIDQTMARYQIWAPVQKYIPLPHDLQPTDELTFYVWHSDPNGDLLFLDDLTLEGW